MAALAATFSANFFFLSKAWFALAISCSLFISFNFAGSISHSLAGASFWGFSNSYSSVSATSLLSEQVSHNQYNVSISEIKIQVPGEGLCKGSS
ncbi:hypothetical protein JHK84_057252 [Glycine max]|nr:hypothetical protein JHK86_057192 [Glycine max]KAG4911355.1 hypothetical protein JHK87_057471 [Glycine soja]KAG5076021.1 hypothetical protein JHK84_057252 [Glycine max]